MTNEDSSKTTTNEQAADAAVSVKKERREALARIKREYAGDPEGAREAARLWFEQHAQPVSEELAETSAFHRRKLEEADPQRALKAAEALKRNEALAELAQSQARAAAKVWRKKNPNKVRKLEKKYRASIKARKSQK